MQLSNRSAYLESKFQASKCRLPARGSGAPCAAAAPLRPAQPRTAALCLTSPRADPEHAPRLCINEASLETILRVKCMSGGKEAINMCSKTIIMLLTHKQQVYGMHRVHWMYYVVGRQTEVGKQRTPAAFTLRSPSCMPLTSPLICTDCCKVSVASAPSSCC